MPRPWLVAFVLAVAVGWPGTPPGSGVGDATGEVRDADLTALCAPSTRVSVPALPGSPAPRLVARAPVPLPVAPATARPAVRERAATVSARAPPFAL